MVLDDDELRELIVERFEVYDLIELLDIDIEYLLDNWSGWADERRQEIIDGLTD